MEKSKYISQEEINFNIIREKFKKIVNDFTESSSLTNEFIFTVLYTLEIELINELVSNNNQNSYSIAEKKILKNKIYDEFLYLFQNNTHINTLGKFYKKILNFLNENFKKCKKDDIVNFKQLYNKIHNDLLNKFKLSVIPKFIMRTTKIYYKQKHKLTSIHSFSKQLTDEILNTLDIYNTNGELTLDVINLNAKIIGYLLEIMCLCPSNHSLILSNLDEFTNSHLMTIINKFNKATRLQEILSLENEEIIKSELNKVTFLLKEEIKYHKNINLPIVAFVISYFHNLLQFITGLNFTTNKSEDFKEQEQFIVSSFRREIMINLIDHLDKDLNHQINHIFSQTIFLFYNEFPLMKTYLTSKLYNNENKEMKFSFALLDKLISQNKEEKFVEKYKSFTKSVNIKSETSVKKLISKFSSLFSKNNNSQVYNNENNEINTSSLKLYQNPDSSKLVSPHVFICISGFISELAEDDIDWGKFIEGLKHTSDFYLYKWGSENPYSVGIEVTGTIIDMYQQFKTDKGKVIDKIANYRTDNIFLKTKRNSKFYGKLLGYIIASRQIFYSRPISLIGFSLGSSVLKHCLKQIYEIYSVTKDGRLLSIIHNVIFVAGATTLGNEERWTEIFRLIPKGKIINVFSKNDEILNNCFNITTSKVAIGVNRLPLEMNKSINFFNVDFTFMKMGHNEYRDYLHILCDKLKKEFSIL